MPFVSKKHIDPIVRAKYIEKRRQELKSLLSSPILTVEQRATLRREIEVLNTVG